MAHGWKNTADEWQGHGEAMKTAAMYSSSNEEN